MNTRVLPASPDAIMEAARLIRDGEIVAFPTETVYGLGANALNPDAVNRIFQAKGRPGDNPLIAHMAFPEDVAPLIDGEPSPVARKLMDAFWPGPLTMIFPKSAAVPMNVTAGLDTVAIRCPSHPVAHELIRCAGAPIAAPSANRSGRPSPTAASHVFEDMDGRIPLILDGGDCAVGLESTVLDVTGGVPRILRPGGVTAEMIAEAVGGCDIDPGVMHALKDGERPRSPGMKYRHYAPKGDLTIFHGDSNGVAEAICQSYDQALSEGHHPLILAMEGHLSAYGARRAASLGNDEGMMGHRLFALLREADTQGVDILLSEAVEAQGFGLAVMNRLGRAAAFHIVEV